MPNVPSALCVLVSMLVAGGVAHAAEPVVPRDVLIEKSSPDLLPMAKMRAAALKSLSLARPGAGAAALPTIEEVGDVDSFARSVTWLGLTQGYVTLTHGACPTPAEADAPCVALNAAPATTSFSLEDIARVVLPAKASNSLLCHWFSPALTVTYQNTGGTPVVARLNYNPTLTVENEVLNDPALIDPTTGVAFGGKLRTSMTASERFEVPLAAGMVLSSRERDTATCIAGFINKRTLVGTFGLSEAQARQFFRKKTTIRMNISGFTHYVDEANMVLGLRIVGD